MGRELKRVKLDFNWPIGKTWEGYLNPFSKHGTNCPHCQGQSTTAAYRAVERLVRILMCAGDDSRKRPQDFNPKAQSLPMNIPTYPGSPYNRLFPHPYLLEAGIDDPGVELHELTQGLAGRESSFLGHDSIDNWSAMKKILAAAGMKKKWGICTHCKGTGTVWDSPENYKKYNRWRQKEPPKGKGYQMWETVSEGSPISPVFDSPEGLANWLAQHEGGTYEQWMATIDAEWVPSMISGPGIGVMTGVEAAGAGVL